MKCVRRYYTRLAKEFVPYLSTNGGPIIAVAVENEYGSFGDDKQYLAAIRDGMLSRGVDVPLVTSDGPEHDMLLCGQCEGVFQTGNFGSRAVEQFKVLSDYGISPQMCMEFWCGWFDHWGCGKHAHTDAVPSARDFGDALDLGHINIYMFHGGTSFGLMNGSNY